MMKVGHAPDERYPEIEWWLGQSAVPPSKECSGDASIKYLSCTVPTGYWMRNNNRTTVDSQAAGEVCNPRITEEIDITINN